MKENKKYENGRRIGIILSLAFWVFMIVSSISYQSYVRQRELVALKLNKKKYRVFSYSTYIRNALKGFVGFEPKRHKNHKLHKKHQHII